jgi:hypothetical protein
MNQIQVPDSALALLQGQIPYAAEIGSAGRLGPNQVISLSWPKHMEVQDLYPVKSSTYTLPTGTKVAVSCVTQGKVVGIRQTDCPDSFVNPMDPNHDRPCVKVLHGSTHYMLCVFFILLP